MDNNAKEKIIFDININSIQDLSLILLNKRYDFLTIEPDNEKTTLNFRKDWKIVEEKFIKNTIYSEIIVKAKTISGLDVWVTTEIQEWSWETEINWQKYKALSKIVPSEFGEKLFFKLKVIEQKTWAKKEVKPIEIWKLVGFFGALLLVMLIVWGGFLSFVILNAKTIEDVRFFLALWINLNEINSFIWKTVWVFFSLLTIILTIFLIIFLFKFLLTKKIFKRKKTIAWFLSILFFILTFSSATAWLTLDRKVKNLPKWDIMALWDVQLFDNKRYTSTIIEELFKKETKNKEVNISQKKTFSNISTEEAKNLIWPIEILFDVSQLSKKESIWWLKVENYVWKIWNEEIETKTPTLIKNFDQKWNYDVKIKFIFNDWSIREFDNKKAQIPSVWITWVVTQKEKVLKSGAKIVTLDASSLKELWKFKWYNLEKENYIPSEKSIFITDPIFDEAAIELVIENWESKISKIFIIDWEEEWKISWEIDFSKSVLNDKDYIFKVINQKSNEWIWYIEKYIWRINWKIYTKEWDIDNPEKASEIKHIFPIYDNYDISVELIPTSWESKIIKKNIDVKKEVKIKNSLEFFIWWEKIENVKHNKITWEYRLDEFWVPNNLEIDSRYTKSDNENYVLNTVSWDYDADWNIDEEWRIWKISLIKEWRKKIIVNYNFQNIRLDSDQIDVKETIYIEAIKKEHNIVFKVKQNTEYSPAIIWFDASQSTVKDANISKFLWDFGDGITEESDAVIEWHRYLTHGNYNVKLTAITSDWRKFSTTKTIVLKPKAEKVKIKSSLKEAPVYQWIDFDSSESIWDIVWYTWDFGDGEISTEANPTHSYEKPWKYKVKLTADFRNRNLKEDSIEIIITE